MSVRIHPKLEGEFAGVGAGWSDFSGDLDAASAPLVLSYGIQGVGPNDHVAGPGTLTGSLKNGQDNSAATIGYYSRFHSSRRSGWDLGIRLRLSYAYLGTTYYKHVGWLDDVAPLPGVRRERRVQFTAVDWMGHAAAYELVGLPTVTNQRADQALTTLLAAVPVQPVSTTFGSAADVWPYVFDSGSTTALTELQRIAQSDYGMVYLKGDTTGGGRLVFEDRRARLVATPSVTLNDGFHALSVAHPRSDIINRILGAAFPRTADSSIVVLYNLRDTIRIEPGATVTFDAAYTDPNERAIRVAALNMITPVASQDYLFNSVEGGLGTDLTSSLGVSVAFGGSSARVALTNSHGSVAGFVTGFQLRGYGLYAYEAVPVEAKSQSSINTYGENASTLALPYQDSAIIAKAIVDHIVSTRATPVPNGIWVSFYCTTAALAAAAMTADISTCVSLTESVSGIAHSFFINAVKLTSTAGGILQCSWLLAKADTGAYWQMDAGQLDVDSVLAPR